MYILGLSGGVRSGHHDPSAALYHDGKLVAAAEEERFLSVRLGDDSRVGACSLVLHDVPGGVTIAGTPAVPLTPKSEAAGPWEQEGEEGWQSPPSAG